MMTRTSTHSQGHTQVSLTSRTPNHKPWNITFRHSWKIVLRTANRLTDNMHPHICCQWPDSTIPGPHTCPSDLTYVVNDQTQQYQGPKHVHLIVHWCSSSRLHCPTYQFLHLCNVIIPSRPPPTSPETLATTKKWTLTQADAQWIVAQWLLSSLTQPELN